MNCYYHKNESSVAICNDCHKALCFECASSSGYEVPLCSECSEKRRLAIRQAILKEWIISFVLGVVILAITQSQLSDVEASGEEFSFFWRFIFFIMAFYVGASIVAGWLSLSNFTSRAFLFLSLPGWLIYFALKLWLASIIGWMVLPFRMFRNIKLFRENKG